MRRLVAVRILAHQARDVGLFAAGNFRLRRKKLVQLCDKLFGAAQQPDQPRDVVRNKERVLPRVALGEMKSYFLRGERFDETAVLFWAKETGFGVE